jgi:hypothetical protein
MRVRQIIGPLVPQIDAELTGAKVVSPARRGTDQARAAKWIRVFELISSNRAGLNELRQYTGDIIDFAPQRASVCADHASDGARRITCVLDFSPVRRRSRRFSAQ